MGLLFDGDASTTLIRASRQTRIYAATRADGRPVLAKLIDLSAVANGQQLELELERSCALTIDGLAATLAVQRVDDQLVVVSERASGIDLRELGGGAALSLDTFLPIARRTTEILVDLHQHQLVHGDIWPGSVIINRDDGDVSLGPVLSSAQLELDLDDVDRLPYISPEHTGRTSARLDHRSDLYSLGATFYRLLTGTPPFTARQASALIHAHLSERPDPPSERVPQLPVPLSRLIMKLLAKSPARRYPSAAVLLDDLDRLKRSFDANQADITLVGDEPSERARGSATALELREELEFLVGDAKPRLMLISVPPVGDDATLADGLESQILARHGQLGRGQFEAQRRGVPLLGWVRALDDVLAQLLIGPRDELELRRTHIEARVGRLASLLIPLLPRLAQVLGATPPPLRAVGLMASRNRVQLAISRLLAALSESGPLCLVFDDLHVADDDSLALLDALLEGGNCGPVMFVGRLRIGASWPRELVELATRLESSASRPLRGRVLELSELEDHDSPATQLARLDPTDAELLAHAACVGAVFELRELALALDEPPVRLMGPLARCCSAGLLRRAVSGYRFEHGSVRELAAAGVLPAFRRMIDERLGERGLAEALAQPEPDLLTLWTGVDRLDASLDGLSPVPVERRLTLAREQLGAARRAFEFAAYAAALSFLDIAATLLHELEPAQVIDELRFELAFARMQALELLDQPAAGRLAFEAAARGCVGDSEYAHVVAVRIELLSARERVGEATELGLAALRRFGHVLEPKPGAATVLLAVTRAWLAVRGWTTATVAELDCASEPSACAAMTIAAALGPATYAHDPRLCALLSTLHAMLVVRHGRHPSAALALAQLALTIATVLRRTDDATRLADCAMLLAGDPERPDYTRVDVVATLVYALTRPLAETAAKVERAYDRALQLGEFDFVSYLATLRSSAAFELGTHLRSLVQDCHRLDHDLGHRFGTRATATMKTMVRLYGALAAALAGELDSGLGELTVDEHGARVLPINPDSLSAPTQMELYTTKMARGVYFVIMGEHATGLRVLDEIEDYGRVMMGSWSVPRVALAHAIAAASCHAATDDGGERRRLRRLIETRLELCQQWAETSPDNYAAHRDVVLAEHAALLDNHQRSLRLLERARAHAMAHENAYVAALACERMAAHTRARGLPILANGALREAWHIHRQWGARAKLASLQREQHERELGSDVQAHESTAAQHDSGSWTGSSVGLGQLSIDLETVTAALTGIAEELDPERLACKILAAALAHTGADHGALLVEVERMLTLVAIARPEQPVRALSPPADFTEHLHILPMALIELLVHNDKPVVVDDARIDPHFAHDPYVERTRLRSLAGMQLRKRDTRLGIIVLEHHTRVACFDEEQVSVLGFIATTAGAALDNARLYRALRRSENQWRSLVDGAPDLIALFGADGRLGFVNRSLPGWTVGYEPVFVPEAADAWRRTFARVREHGRRDTVEFGVVDELGTLHWYDAHLAPLDYEGDARQVMAIATEITERRAAEAERSALESQLRQQQRLESVGTLASGVAHEINNPVQAILNYAELTISARNEPELVSEFATEIMAESERVATIVRNLLAFSRREATPERELVSLSTVVRGTLSLVHSSLRSSQIELSVEVSDELPPVHCHVQQIQQIIMNLMTNARDALDERWPEHHVNKRIELSCSLVERHGRAHVRLSVIDSGPGIPDSVRAHIFDPFFTTKGRDRGTGLGLSVSHGIARDHGGELWVESEVGVGTRFHLDLPVDLPVGDEF